MIERKTWLVVAICALVFILWQKTYVEKQKPAASSSITTTAAATVSAATTPVVQQKQTVDHTIQIRNSSLAITNENSFIRDWTLNTYRVSREKDAAAVRLVDVIRAQTPLLMAFDSNEYLYLEKVKGNLTEENGRVIWRHEDEKIAIEREFRHSPNLPYIDVTLKARFKGAAPKYAFVSMFSETWSDDPEKMDRKLAYWVNDEIETAALDSKIDYAADKMDGSSKSLLFFCRDSTGERNATRCSDGAVAALWSARGAFKFSLSSCRGLHDDFNESIFRRKGTGASS